MADKHAQLASILLAHSRVAVAFSGGVDSSLLLKVALDVLGAGNVMPIHASSCLEKPEEKQRAESWGERNGFRGLELVRVDLYPLGWKPFVENGPERCYHCKLAMYKEFFDVMDGRGFTVLADGTNTDDLKQRRPGLRAISELGVVTPLVEAGLDKDEIRELARKLGLDNSDAPSASCLATRIPHGMAVTAEALEQVANYEAGVEKLGFSGCRVRLRADDRKAVVIQIQGNDFERFSRPGMRIALIRFFQKMGINKVLLDLDGR